MKKPPLERYTASEIVFKFRNLPSCDTKTIERVAVSIETRERAYIYSTMTIYIGRDVLKLLGWAVGYDRVQFEEHRDGLAIGRQCGQFKLSDRSTGTQGTISISGRYFDADPPERMPLTPLDYNIIKLRGREKALIIPSAEQIFKMSRAATTTKRKGK